jgi:hypothetical protein
MGKRTGKMGKMTYRKIGRENPSVLTLVNPGKPPRRKPSRRKKTAAGTGGTPVVKTKKRVKRVARKPRLIFNSNPKPKRWRGRKNPIPGGVLPKGPLSAAKARLREEELQRQLDTAQRKLREAKAQTARRERQRAEREELRQLKKKPPRVKKAPKALSDKQIESLAKGLRESTAATKQMIEQLGATHVRKIATMRRKASAASRKATRAERQAVSKSVKAWKAGPRAAKMPAWDDHQIPPMPTGAPPRDPRRGHLALLDPWRPYVKGRPAPGWHWQPAKAAGYTYKQNPKRGGKKAKKGSSRRKGALSRMWGKLKSWKRNPATGVGDIVRYGAAGVGGYVGAGLVGTFVRGRAARLVGGHPAVAEGLTGLAGLVAVHFLARTSDTYYSAAMAGAAINVGKNLVDAFGGQLMTGVKELLPSAEKNKELLPSAEKNGGLSDDLDVYEMALQGGPSDVELLDDLETEDLGAYDGSFDVPLSDDEIVDEVIMDELEGYGDELSDDDDDDEDELGTTVDDILASAASGQGMNDYVAVPESMSDYVAVPESMSDYVAVPEGMSDIDYEESLDDDLIPTEVGLDDYVAVPEGMSDLDATAALADVRVHPPRGSGMSYRAMLARRAAAARRAPTDVRHLRSVVEAAVARIPGVPGTRTHCVAVYRTTKEALGLGTQRMAANWKRAYLVAYRAATAGPRAAVKAAVATGAPVPAAVKRAVGVKTVKVQPPIPAVAALREKPTNLEQIIERAQGQEPSDEIDILETHGGIFGGSIFSGNIFEGIPE